MALQLKWMMLPVSLWQVSIKKANRKRKKNMYVPNRGTNEQGQENQEKEVPSARQGDKNSGDIQYNLGAPPPLDLDRSDWSAAEESVSF
jgi:hypothetical protein